MRIFGHAGMGRNTCKPRKVFGKKTKAEKRLAARKAKYDAEASRGYNEKAGYRCPGSLQVS